MILPLLRAAFLALEIFAFCLGGLVLALAPLSYRLRALAQAHWMSLWSRIALRTLGVQCQVVGEPNSFDGPRLIVANHVSYLDVLAISARFPTMFVTSIETRGEGLSGILSRCAGVLFVERRSRSGIPRELARLCATLREGCTLTLFPEATSTEGEAILPFKSTFFQAAVVTETPVLPLCIRYRQGREAASYYGSMTLVSHLWKLLRSQEKERIELELRIAGGPLASHGSDRRSLSTRSFQLIQAAFCDIQAS